MAMRNFSALDIDDVLSQSQFLDAGDGEAANASLMSIGFTSAIREWVYSANRRRG